MRNVQRHRHIRLHLREEQGNWPSPPSRALALTNTGNTRACTHRLSPGMSRLGRRCTRRLLEESGGAVQKFVSYTYTRNHAPTHACIHAHPRTQQRTPKCNATRQVTSQSSRIRQAIILKRQCGMSPYGSAGDQSEYMSREQALEEGGR